MRLKEFRKIKPGTIIYYTNIWETGTSERYLLTLSKCFKQGGAYKIKVIILGENDIEIRNYIFSKNWERKNKRTSTKIVTETKQNLTKMYLELFYDMMGIDL
jgi:hypothetical protein